MAESLIIRGRDAIAAARYLKHNGFCEAAFDLGPDFGQDTARIYLTNTGMLDGRAMTPRDWLELMEHWRDVNHWFDNVGADWQVTYDGPPYKEEIGGGPAVEGTPIE